MTGTVPRIAIAGLAATAAVAVAMVVHLNGQQPSKVSGDFRNANIAEVRDAQGQVLLQGTFAAAAGDEDEIERVATLAATTAGGHAAGDAEIEYRKDDPNTQEIEFQVSGVPARAVVSLVIDGTAVLSATANDKGRAEAEANVALTPR